VLELAHGLVQRDRDRALALALRRRRPQEHEDRGSPGDHGRREQAGHPPPDESSPCEPRRKLGESHPTRILAGVYGRGEGGRPTACRTSELVSRAIWRARSLPSSSTRSTASRDSSARASRKG